MTQTERCPALEDRGSLERMIGQLRERAARGERVLVALDGRCAAGKTTLANALGERYGWNVVHMDHFFLRPEQRNPQRLSVPGENVDHERFFEEVMLPLREGRPVCYRPFDCHAMAMGEPIQLDPRPVTIVEGAYACHRTLWEFYQVRAFLTVDPDLQQARIRQRNGLEGLRAFQERWIPLEEAYFAAWKLEQRCDYLLGQ